ncbi:MAG: tetratricopeptide repeat protein [Rhodoglobus sp.]
MDSANALALKGEHSEAIKLYSEAARLGVDAAIFNAGNSYAALGDLEQARKSLQLAGSAGVWEAWLNLGHVCCELGRRKQALQAFLRAAAHGDSKGSVEAAWHLRDLNRPVEADHLLRVAADGGNDLAAGALGQILFEEIYKNDAQAEVPDHVTSLLKRGSSNLTQARISYALVLQRSGRIKEAISWLSDDTENQEVAVIVALANLLLDAGRTSEGRQLLQQAIKLGDKIAKARLRVLEKTERTN